VKPQESPATVVPLVVLATKSGALARIKGELASENGTLCVRQRRGTKVLGALSELALVKLPLKGDYSAEIVFTGGDTWRLATFKGGFLDFFEALTPGKVQRAAPNSNTARNVGVGFLSFLRPFIAKHPVASALVAIAVVGWFIGLGVAGQRTVRDVHAQRAAVQQPGRLGAQPARLAPATQKRQRRPHPAAGEQQGAPTTDVIPGRAQPGKRILAKTVAPLFRRCRGKKDRDMIGGDPRVICIHDSSSPAFMVELIGTKKDGYRSANVMIETGSTPSEVADQMILGGLFFNRIAGAKVGDFMPDGWVDELADGVSHAYDGRKYTIKPMPELGVVMWHVETVGS
jgi:hypothetical protein